MIRTFGIDGSRANTTQRTGTEWYSYHLMRALYEVVPHDTRIEVYLRSPLLPDMQMPHDVARDVYLRWPPKKLWTQLRLTARMIRKKPDALFVPAHTLPLVVPRATVTTVHDVGFATHPELYSQKELRYHRFALQRAMNSAARIITVSEFTRRELVKLYPKSENKISAILSGFTPAQRIGTDTASQLVHTMLGDRPYVLYIGRIEDKKNILNMLHAFERAKDSTQSLSDLQFALIGGWGTGSDAIKEYIASSRYASDIRVLGYRSADEKQAALQKCAALIFVTNYEGFGIPPLEAMAAGAPVLTSSTTAAPEICATAALYAGPGDVEMISRELVKLLTDESLRRELIVKGEQRIMDFSWHRCAEETWGVIQQAYSETQ